MGRYQKRNLEEVLLPVLACIFLILCLILA